MVAYENVTSFISVKYMQSILIQFLNYFSYTGGSPSCEFGDFSVVNCLTGWLPEAIPLQ